MKNNLPSTEEMQFNHEWTRIHTNEDEEIQAPTKRANGSTEWWPGIHLANLAATSADSCPLVFIRGFPLNGFGFKPRRNPFTWLALAVWGMVAAEGLKAADTTSLRQALTFHASFDHGSDADFGQGDRRIFNTPSLKHPRIGTPGLPTNGVISVAKGEGKVGAALRFHRKAPEVAFFQVDKNLAYAKSNWNGTVSFWLRLDPDADLEPGYCDPLQITPRDWNDGAFWVDFSKDERPRHFRLGAFPDRAVWDPNRRDYDKVPEAERPMVTVTKPPFTRQHWTHVVFTFANFNTGKKDGVATLYLDGKSQGAVSAREQTFSWDPANTIAMVGIAYTGLFDELAFFNRALTAVEVEEIFALPGGITALRK